jgi:hypothetical protein
MWARACPSTPEAGCPGQIGAARETEMAAKSDRAAACERPGGGDPRRVRQRPRLARENARVLTARPSRATTRTSRTRKNRQDLGLIASHEVLAVTVERERAELGRVQAENATAVATANLLRLVGPPAGTTISNSTLRPARPRRHRNRRTREARTAARPGDRGLRARIRAMEASAKVARRRVAAAGGPGQQATTSRIRTRASFRSAAPGTTRGASASR